MLYPGIDMAQRVAEEQLQDRLRKAETDRIVREAGIDRRGWSSRLASRMLSGVGHVLVAAGRRLEGHSLPATGSSATMHANRPASARR